RGHLSAFADDFSEIMRQRNNYLKKIRKELEASERAMAQIIQVSTIPTFVINKDHMVTHWNKACEKLTGFRAEEMVGTKKHWKPFRTFKRPTMADLIVDEVSEEDALKYYCTRWRKSALIEGAYEAEEYFSHFGDGGKWLFFSAAPIKASDGTILGAVETLLDRTEERKSKYQLEKYARELAERTEKLIESERIMTQIVQGSTIPTFVINQNHMVTHWNKAMERLSGFPAEKIVGTKNQWKPFWDQERPSMADVVLDQTPEDEIQQLYGTKWRKSVLIPEAYEAEVFFPKLGESGKWCYFTAAPIKAPDGKIIGAIETLWDKTEDKKAEEDRERHNRQLSALCSIYTALGSSLRLEESLYDAVRELFNYLSVDSFCIFLMDEDGFFSLKYSYGKESGFCEKESLLDKSNIMYEAVKNGQVILYEDLTGSQYEGIRKFVKEGLKSLSLIPLINKKKEIFGVIQIGSRRSQYFTSEQKNVLSLIGNRIGAAIENSQLYEKYRKSEKKYRSLFDNDPNPIFIVDSGTFEILDINQRAQECYGYSRPEILGMSFWDIGEKNDEELVNDLRNITRNRSLLFSKKRHFRKGGISFFVNIHVSRSEYFGKDVLIASTTDITESIRKETQLIQASKMTTLGIMAAGMAHEINQPLNVIQVCSDTLLKMIQKGVALNEGDLKGIVADISKNVQRAAGIIKHMRDFSRRSEGVRSKVNINGPIQDVFKVLGHQLKMHRVELVLDLDPSLPDIYAEYNRLEQVFINMVTNAVDAMDEKEKKLGDKTFEKILKIRSFMTEGFVTVTVADTGTGMTPEVMEKIYEPFFTTKEVGKGTGLGFSISYGIIKDYNGTVDISSQIGKGTTFEVRFPAAT
ncbi:MAG: PAS domain S-box protein, partial [Thermodesulfobacteriota bacterium]